MVLDTLPKVLVNRVEMGPNRIAFRYKDLGIWRSVTYGQYLEKVKYVALGLYSLGLRKGNCVSIIGENRPEWLYTTLGNMSAGGISVGVYVTNSAEEVRHVVENSDSMFYFAEDEEQYDKSLIFRRDTPKLKKIMVWDMKGLKNVDDPMLISFDEFLEIGRKVNHENRDLFGRLVQGGNKEDIAVIVYTSGTTGPPKGAMLSHGNCLYQADRMCQLLELSEKDETISFLPLNHVFECLFDVMMHCKAGYTINITESTATVMRDLIDISPTFLQSVPRIWEKYHSSIILKVQDATWFKRKVFNMARSIGTKYSELVLARKKVPLVLRLLYKLAYFCVFWKLRERLGFGNLRLGTSGAAPISHDIVYFFESIGVPIRDGYGLTETTAATHMSTFREFKLGSVGKALPGTQAKIAEDGELLVKGDGVFKGYYGNEEMTKQILIDGWLYTGDIGEIDEEGYLKITDRKKDLIITAGGKNIAPQYIENKLKCSVFINDAIVIGDKRKFVSAIIVIDEENVEKYAQNKKVQYTTFASLTRTAEVKRLIQEEIDNVNEGLSKVEQIKAFRILDKKLYTEDGEVTPTMKVKRKFINEAYAELIESMYTEDVVGSEVKSAVSG